MDKLNTYTSTGNKLLKHPELLLKLKRDKKAFPISLQVAPESRCNLKCVFCSNTNRDKYESLDKVELGKFIRSLWNKGLRTVEWTGGGDPTMYDNIQEMMIYSHALGLDQGLITNGVVLKETIHKRIIGLLKWVRISMNCLDYVDSISLPTIKGTLGFSYVINKNTNNDVFKKLGMYVKKHKPAYVRIVPDCQTTVERQIENNDYWSKMVYSWGEPYFYQAKMFSKPERCWWGHIKPFLLHDGFIYPCSSVVLNEDSDRSFHTKYRWFSMEEFVNHYQEKIIPFPNSSCNHCVFKPQNDLVDSLLNPIEMENFI
jgi:MoaA/NifB/PqqE/SkfB family radical SAM enzyme